MVYRIQKIINIGRKLYQYCANDDYQLGINFNSMDLYNYCKQHYLISKKINDFTNLQKLWKERLQHYKEANPYYALVGFSEEIMRSKGNKINQGEV